MGRLTFPPASRIYTDTSPIIYTTERHAEYSAVLEPFWNTAKSGDIEVITSELTLLEVLVVPIRENAEVLIETYDQLFAGSEIELYPISTAILREAARLRATQNFKTPDAIHAATASVSGCSHFVTNDPTFRRLVGTEVCVLGDLV